MPELVCGQVVWVNLNPVVGSEQAGHRPAVVVSSDEYLAAIPNVVIVLPITTRDRGLPNHVRLRGSTGLDEACFAMTEQPRTIDRRRITDTAGEVDRGSLRELRLCLARFLGIDHD
nr:type II toxin-antitoxin system PemK/MazF family toxin [Blastococcus sp. Marseille-P5729]